MIKRITNIKNKIDKRFKGKKIQDLTEEEKDILLEIIAKKLNLI